MALNFTRSRLRATHRAREMAEEQDDEDIEFGPDDGLAVDPLCDSFAAEEAASDAISDALSAALTECALKEEQSILFATAVALEQVHRVIAWSELTPSPLPDMRTHTHESADGIWQGTWTGESEAQTPARDRWMRFSVPQRATSKKQRAKVEDEPSPGGSESTVSTRSTGK